MRVNYGMEFPPLIIHLQKEVMEKHLREFGLTLAEKLCSRKKTGFYRIVARVIAVFFSK